VCVCVRARVRACVREREREREFEIKSPSRIRKNDIVYYISDIYRYLNCQETLYEIAIEVKRYDAIVSTG